jgi:hypothetical protein
MTGPPPPPSGAPPLELAAPPDEALAPPLPRVPAAPVPPPAAADPPAPLAAPLLLPSSPPSRPCPPAPSLDPELPHPTASAMATRLVAFRLRIFSPVGGMWPGCINAPKRDSVVFGRTKPWAFMIANPIFGETRKSSMTARAADGAAGLARVDESVLVRVVEARVGTAR